MQRFPRVPSRRHQSNREDGPKHTKTNQPYLFTSPTRRPMTPSPGFVRNRFIGTSVYLERAQMQAEIACRRRELSQWIPFSFSISLPKVFCTCLSLGSYRYSITSLSSVSLTIWNAQAKPSRALPTFHVLERSHNNFSLNLTAFPLLLLLTPRTRTCVSFLFFSSARNRRMLIGLTLWNRGAGNNWVCHVNPNARQILLVDGKGGNLLFPDPSQRLLHNSDLLEGFLLLEDLVVRRWLGHVLPLI